MANTPSAKKRARQATTRRNQNISIKSRTYTFIKKARNLITAADKDKAPVAGKAAIQAIDRGVSHGMLHKNKAARLKSRLNAQLKKLVS